jgi:hypothetical protein
VDRAAASPGQPRPNGHTWPGPSPDPGHPFAYPAACFLTGTILGSAVPCLSPEQQVYFHQGYEAADHDRHDMTQLRQAFGIATHFCAPSDKGSKSNFRICQNDP